MNIDFASLREGAEKEKAERASQFRTELNAQTEASKKKAEELQSLMVAVCKKNSEERHKELEKNIADAKRDAEKTTRGDYDEKYAIYNESEKADALRVMVKRLGN